MEIPPPCYLHSDDDEQKLLEPYRAGQTFRVNEITSLEFIDLQIKRNSFQHNPSINIYFAGTDHKPFGPSLAHSIFMMYPYDTAFGSKRVRFKMSPLTLDPVGYYCIVVNCTPALLAVEMKWLYDKADAQYPAGMRVLSLDNGATWTVYHDDDHLFCVGSSPPVQTAPPEPPISNIAIISFRYVCTATGYKVFTSTSSPCHGWLYWTPNQPEKHLHPLYRRGAQFSNKVQFCFTAWYKVEQEEEGDTIYHTFIMEPWEICETRWFTFRYQVAGEWSPSVGPIIQKHRKQPQELVIYASNTNRTIYYTHLFWPPCHDSPTGTVAVSHLAPSFSCSVTTIYTTQNGIARNYLDFNIPELPPHSQICNAYLDLFVWNKDCGSSVAHPDIFITPGQQNLPPIPTDFGAQLPYDYAWGSKDIRDFTVDAYNRIYFDPLPLGYISPGVLNKFCLRQGLDLDNKAPALGSNHIRLYSQQKGLPYKPRLVILYEIL